MGSNPTWDSDFFQVLLTLNLSCSCCFIFKIKYGIPLSQKDSEPQVHELYAGIRKASDESLGRDETPRHTSHEIKLFTSTYNFLLHITRELAVGNPSAIEGQVETANILTSRTGL